ncbi:UDP-glucuronosyltransferase 1-1 [Chionoecetes opilio]|uniref:UDP-glucuronosyltransferase 1-1 n=1 Tax=Chionoecetes opilio TaxID=41210 RepID=A0A8J4XSH2_CHIOP|nr:UDP-glucuronosyltransferase 1-1 [Chionoecetes opilio]
MPEEHRKILVECLGHCSSECCGSGKRTPWRICRLTCAFGKWPPNSRTFWVTRLRLFITHGGLLSTLESMYHGVSVLGMPVFADQHTNMMEVEQNGWGKVLHWSELTPETLRQKISEVINDKSLREEAQRRSVVMRDQAQRPEDVAVFWVEYVLRHHGAPHLVSPVRSMPWYQLYNVDIWVTLLVVDLLIIYALYKVLRALCRCIFSNKTKQKSE